MESTSTYFSGIKREIRCVKIFKSKQCGYSGNRPSCNKTFHECSKMGNECSFFGQMIEVINTDA